MATIPSGTKFIGIDPSVTIPPERNGRAINDMTGHYAIGDVLSEANSYSNTETLTGGNWIDGKPIYRKVIQSNTNDFINLDTFEVIHNLSIETYLKHDVVVNQIGLIGLTEKPATFNLADCTIDSFNLIFNLDLLTSFNTNSITSETYFKKDNDIDFSLVLEYTKTTD